MVLFQELPWLPGTCTPQLVEVHDYIGSLLDAGKQTDVIYMDMSKAFDKVNHQILIHKLYNCFGISGVYSVGSPPTC
jgi:hypothetical protein